MRLRSPRGPHAALSRCQRIAAQAVGVLSGPALPEPQLIALLANITGEVQALDATRSAYPATRRLLWAALVRHQLPALAADAWTAELQQALLRLAGALFHVHRRGSMFKRVIEFLHVSKSGGTSICLLAGEAGCRNPDFNTKRNCLIRAFDDGPRWVSEEGHKMYSPPGNKVGRPWFVRHERPRIVVPCAHRKNYMQVRVGLHWGPARCAASCMRPRCINAATKARGQLRATVSSRPPWAAAAACGPACGRIATALAQQYALLPGPQQSPALRAGAAAAAARAAAAAAALVPAWCWGPAGVEAGLSESCCCCRCRCWCNAMPSYAPPRAASGTCTPMNSPCTAAATARSGRTPARIC